MNRSGVLAAAQLPLLLGSCAGGGRAPTRGLQPPRSVAPQDRETRMCTARLSDQRFDFRSLPDRRFEGGCSAVGAVQLLDIGTPVTNLGAMRCGLAEAFAGWVRYGVVPASRQILGSEVVKVESFGTYACRGIVGNAKATRLSEHAVSNAVDIGAFRLADGRRVAVLGGWTSPDPAVRTFLRTIHGSACKRFRTVLGPDYNSAHANHLHMDMGGSAFCR